MCGNLLAFDTNVFPWIYPAHFCLKATASAYLRLIANSNKPIYIYAYVHRYTCACKSFYNNAGKQRRTAFATIAAMHVGAFCLFVFACIAGVLSCHLLCSLLQFSRVEPPFPGPLGPLGRFQFPVTSYQLPATSYQFRSLSHRVLNCKNKLRIVRRK